MKYGMIEGSREKANIPMAVGENKKKTILSHEKCFYIYTYKSDSEVIFIRKQA